MKKKQNKTKTVEQIITWSTAQVIWSKRPDKTRLVKQPNQTAQEEGFMDTYFPVPFKVVCETDDEQCQALSLLVCEDAEKGQTETPFRGF